MVDPIQLAIDTLGTILPTENGHYAGTAPLYAVVSEIETYNDYTDDDPSMEHTGVQVDVWQRGKRPEQMAKKTRIALEERGFRRTRRGSDTEEVNGVTWRRVSTDYDYSQEVD